MRKEEMEDRREKATKTEREREEGERERERKRYVIGDYCGGGSMLDILHNYK